MKPKYCGVVSGQDTAQPSIYNEGPVYCVGITQDMADNCVTLELLYGHSSFNCRIPYSFLLTHKLLRDWILTYGAFGSGAISPLKPIPPDVLTLISKATKAEPAEIPGGTDYDQDTMIPRDEPWIREFCKLPKQPEPTPAPKLPEEPRRKRLVKI